MDPRRLIHRLVAGMLASFAILAANSFAQEPAGTSQAAAPAAVVPQTIRFSGLAPNRAGDDVEAVFNIYAGDQGGEPVWSEKQTVKVGADGRYSVLLGSASQGGLPQSVFADGQARWVGVSIERGEERPRTLLVSVPYAMKSADAETLAGRRAEEFVTQAQLSATAKSLATKAAALAIPMQAPTGSGTAGYLPVWTGSSTLGNSFILQTGTATAPLIGIGIAKPGTTLDVMGGAAFRDAVVLLWPTAATRAAAVPSPLVSLVAQNFSSELSESIRQTFSWQVYPGPNNVATPSGSLQLLYGLGFTSPTPVGFSVASNGFVTANGLTSQGDVTVYPGFPANSSFGSSSHTWMTVGVYDSSTKSQVFPRFSWTPTAVGNNTSSPSASLDLQYWSTTCGCFYDNGFSISASGIVSFAPGQTFPGAGGGGTITGVTAGSGLKGGGSTGSVNLAVDPTKVPFLNGDNFFVGDESITGFMSVAGGFRVTNGGYFGSLQAANGIQNTGTISILPTGSATASAGAEGARVELAAQVVDTANKTVISPWLGWEAEPVENNTANPSVKLDFEYGPDNINSSNVIIKTGLDINSDGTVDFVGTQTFPNTVSTSESMYEGFGSGRLDNGATVIRLDADFLAKASTDVPYHVYLTPNGDSRGLYVTNKTPGSFEVHESGGGTSSIEFDYRIVAKRNGSISNSRPEGKEIE
jgi:hypothetical protein